MASKGKLDAVSFMFAQVLTQVDYLFETGHLSQENYSLIAGALLQATPPSTPIQEGPSVLPLQTPATSWSLPAQASLASSVFEPAQAQTTITHASSPPKPIRTTSSLLKFKSKPSSLPNVTSPAPSPSTSKLPQATGHATEGASDEEPELGKVNRRIRKALQGGFLLGQVVDQALALTPFIPEGVRESLVEKVEEESGEYVRKITDPRNQAMIKQRTLKAGNTVWKVASGGGGTSRASSRLYVDASGRDSAFDTSGGAKGEFSLMLSGSTAGTGEESISTTSVHSFRAEKNVMITTVVTATHLESKAKFAQQSDHEGASSRLVYDPSVDYQDADDPRQITGRDW